MKDRSTHSLSWLLTRSLLPSTTSVLFSIIASVIFIVLGLLFWSVTYGTILPSFFGGELATLYTNVIVQPIDALTHTTLWNGGVTIIMYSLVGAFVYQVAATAINAYTAWRRAKHYVQFDSRYMITRSHLDKPLLFQFAWRFMVSIAAVVFLIVATPLLHWALTDIQLAVVAVSLTDIMRRLSFVFLVAVLMLHCCVVLLRLYAMRTRLFGDDIVYEGESQV